MGEGAPPQISVAVGVTVGLIASFIQSLGLTIQRKSHLQNEALPLALRKRDFRRPLWITGFLVFICSNLCGTIFQIGALPIVVLGPLGAVSLLYNAFFAKVILGDRFSLHLIAGTILIAGGAVLIGIFGVVPETTHTLDELVALYSRSAFIVWISLLSSAIVAVLTTAHVAEWQLERRLHKASGGAPGTTGNSWRKQGRKASGSGMLDVGETVEERSPLLPKYGEETSTAINALPLLVSRNSAKVDAARRQSPPSLEVGTERDVKAPATLSAEAIERTKLYLGVAFGVASGTLSGLCLLFAKTGVELLILTIVGQNQFGRIQAWLIILLLLCTALLQLYYLNHALRLSGPTLICPLAFCFYNLSSIISGLIYYDQWSMLSALQFGMVGLGTVVLLIGVWVVSLKAGPDCGGDDEEEEMEGLLTEEPEELAEHSPVDENQWVPRGLAMGLGAASPGFEIRPQPTHARRRSQSTSTPPPRRSTEFARDSSLVEAREDDADLPGRVRRERARGASMSGALYTGVRIKGGGMTSPGSEEGEARVSAEGAALWRWAARKVRANRA